MPSNQTNQYPRPRRLLPAYIRAGLLLHAMTIMELIVLAVFAPGLLWFQAESATGAVLNTMILAFLVSLPILSQLDARSRFQSYKRVKDSLHKHGFDPRILKPCLWRRQTNWDTKRIAAAISAPRATAGTISCRIS